MYASGCDPDARPRCATLMRDPAARTRASGSRIGARPRLYLSIYMYTKSTEVYTIHTYIYIYIYIHKQIAYKTYLIPVQAWSRIGVAHRGPSGSRIGVAHQGPVYPGVPGVGVANRCATPMVITYNTTYVYNVLRNYIIQYVLNIYTYIYIYIYIFAYIHA